mgnify:CR=1 FL=1
MIEIESAKKTILEITASLDDAANVLVLQTIDRIYNEFEKFNKYIIVAKEKSSKKWIVLSKIKNPSITSYECVESINIKHKDILEEYLNDNKISIKYKADNLMYWQVCNEGKFIESYDENFEWRINK